MSAKKSQKKISFTGKELLNLIYNRLQMHSALGVDLYPATADLQRFFRLTGKNALQTDGMRESTAEENGRQQDSRAGGPDRQLQLLNKEIADCTLCPLHKEKSGIVYGSGSISCRLMVIGDWSEQKKEAFAANVYFGPDEDLMLWKMMAAIGLQPDDIYVTNCLKCCPDGTGSPDSTCEKTCFSFLEREIAMIRPMVICAMGEVACGLLTGRPEPLARQRGKFVRYRYQSKNDIMVMPTYHPRFLLRHQEMKKATWLDLQAIQKKLAEK